jgi:hypothetical protein
MMDFLNVATVPDEAAGRGEANAWFAPIDGKANAPAAQMVFFIKCRLCMVDRFIR